MAHVRNLVHRHPFIFTGLVLVALIVGSVVSFAGGMALRGDRAGEALGGFLARLLVSGLFLLLILRLHWLTLIGFTKTGRLRSWMLVLATLVYSVFCGNYSLFGDFDIIFQPSVLAGLITLKSLSIGLLEETVFRGIILFTLITHWGRSLRALTKSVILSSLLFGSVHLLNIAAGKPPVDTAMQVLNSSLAGIFYAALVLWVGSIWPAIFFHGMVDAFPNIRILTIQNFQETLVGTLILGLLQIPLLILGLYLIANSVNYPRLESRRSGAD